MAPKWLHQYAILVALCTLFLIVAGASVTSNEAGLSVPDWPLSYGKWMPVMEGGVFYEHGHRMVAQFVGLLVVVLAVLLARYEPRRWMRNLGYAAVALVIIQGVLGGLTVLLMLPKSVSMAHASLAQVFFSTMVAIAVFTSPLWGRGAVPVLDAGWPSIRSLAIVTPALVFVQLVLGAAFRHKAAGVVPHIAGAMVVTACVMLLAVFTLAQYPDHAALRRSAHALMGVTVFQMLLGIGAYLARLSAADRGTHDAVMVASTVAHVATGAVTMAASVVMTLHVLRNVRKPLPEAAAVSGDRTVPVS